jgi:hypothetical protein
VTHVHDHHAGGTTIVDREGDGPATALIVLVALVLIAALIWFFAFSGVVFDRGTTTDNGPDVNIQNPPAQQNNTNTNTDPGTQPNPNPNPS